MISSIVVFSVLFGVVALAMVLAWSVDAANEKLMKSFKEQGLTQQDIIDIIGPEGYRKLTKY